jgi:hypothetical protein
MIGALKAAVRATVQYLLGNGMGPLTIALVAIGFWGAILARDALIEYKQSNIESARENRIQAMTQLDQRRQSNLITNRSGQSAAHYRNRSWLRGNISDLTTWRPPMPQTVLRIKGAE